MNNNNEMNNMNYVNTITEEDKIKSAYALNLCTVSVSQIVDYDDLHVLEQEYDAILNNLNLENIIKRDSLLNILKQILDTITYFKMEDIEKKLIEEEYQQQMKNGLWSSAPNFGLIVAGGNPLTMAVSLASQIGIGYMNYRKNKNDYILNKDKKLLKLQQAAMEQLNGLRRELFTTAWDLAETYNFPDEFRLTEKQITQYNYILNDPNPISKYERLDYIKNNFNAYPPFWYFYGSTANYIANARDLNRTDKFVFSLSEDTRNFFRNAAKSAFKKYEELDKYNLLREDQITASFALEYADMLIAENVDENRHEIKKLIDRAVKMVPNSYDILELCAIAYLKINDRTSAVPLLKFFVNEDYNKTVNAQLLSSIYVHAGNTEEYEILKTKVSSEYLFPMPKEGQSLEQSQKEFISCQKAVLQKKYFYVIDELVQKYSKRWNRLFSTFDCSMKYDDSFFSDSRKTERISAAIKTFSDNETKTKYNEYLRNLNIQSHMIDILNDSYNSFFSLDYLNDSELKKEIKKEILTAISENREVINSLVRKACMGVFSFKDYEEFQKISFEKFYEPIITKFKDWCKWYLDYINQGNISKTEGNIRLVCRNEKIADPEIVVETKTENRMNTNNPFSTELFGVEAYTSQKRAEMINSVATFAKDHLSSLSFKNDDNLQILFRGDSDFDAYFSNRIFNGQTYIKANTLAVFKDKTKARMDLLFTSKGIGLIRNGRINKELYPYSEVELKNDYLIVYKNALYTAKYLNSAIDNSDVYNFIRKLDDKLKVHCDCTDIIDNVNMKAVSEWFEANSNFNIDLKCGLAYPTFELVSKIFGKDFELPFDHNILIQFVLDAKTNAILAHRIIKYENIDTNLQAQIEEHGGRLIG